MNLRAVSDNATLSGRVLRDLWLRLIERANKIDILADGAQPAYRSSVSLASESLIVLPVVLPVVLFVELREARVCI